MHLPPLGKWSLAIGKNRVCLRSPHPSSNILLFLADGVRVDRSCLDIRMPHPLRKHVQRHSRNAAVNPEGMPQAFRRAVSPFGNSRLFHHRLDHPPRMDAAPSPKRGILHLWPSPRLLDVVNHIQCIQKFRRHRHGTKNIIPAFLEAAKDYLTGRDIHTLGRDLQGFGKSAPCKEQRLAEGSAFPLLLACGRKEGVTFLGVEIEAVSLGVEEPHFRSVFGHM